MARKASRGRVGRRGFLAGMAAAGAATGLTAPGLTDPARAAPAAGAPPGIRPPTSLLAAAETASPAAAEHAETLHIGRSGSDHMVDAIKALGIEYVASMPGSSFRGLHESLINY